MIAFLTLLDDVPLTKGDQQLVENFRADPEGRGFLSIVELLNSCSYHDEALELLQIGLANHPQFTAARVILAKELFNRGMVEETLAVLDQSPTNLQENILAQKIKLKVLLVVGNEQRFVEVLELLNRDNLFDDQCLVIVQCYHLEGFNGARQKFIDRLRGQGVVISLSQPPIENPEQPVPLVCRDFSDYWIMSIDEIFVNGCQSSVNSSFTLETKTMAQIYEDQGHYSAALAIYRRLLAKSPQTAFYRHKVMEVSQLSQKQQQDTLLDPATINRLEQLDRLEIKISSCRNFLARLHQPRL